MAIDPNSPSKDLEEAIVALAQVASFVVGWIKSGKFDFSKALALEPALKLAVEDYKNALAQVTSLNPAAAARVEAALESNLSIDNAKAKDVVLALVNLLGPGIKLYEAIKEPAAIPSVVPAV